MMAAALAFAALCWPAWGAGPPAAPYSPDEHTLMLHHFDGNTAGGGTAADHAGGTALPVAQPNVARHFVAGKFGKALVFSRTERELRFATRGNYQASVGTVEFFVRLPDLGLSPLRNSRGFWQTAGGTPPEKLRFVIGIGDFNTARTGTKASDLFADLLDGQLGLKVSMATWKADEWHHVAVLWDAGSARLLVDGVRVAEGAHPALESAPFFEVGTCATLIMDELRISDIVREELEMSTAGNAPTPLKPISAAANVPRPLPALPPSAVRPATVTLQPGVPNLFVDDWLIDTQSNLIRRLGQVTKYEKNPVIAPEGLWEETAAFPFGGGAYRLGEHDFRLWYNTYIRWRRGKDGTSCCYATSTDGRHWDKPRLGLVEVRGSRDNNVVFHTPMDNSSVVYDPADPKPERRFKMAVYRSGEQGTGVYVSADGLRWTELPNILVKDAGDRTSLWHDTVRHKYVLFTRYSPLAPGRYIFRIESDDFETWGTPELILHWTEMDRVHGIQHYGADGFTYGGMYLGFLEVFHVPYRRLDTQLICSRDGRSWQRVCEGEVFLGNGPEGSFDRFWAFPASTPPVPVGDELWLYYQGRGHPHTGPQPPLWPGTDETGAARNSFWAATGLARLRVDGFAALDASGEEGIVITVPLSFARGRTLHINADADNYPPGSSWLRVEILDENYAPVRGFEAARFDVMTRDAVDHVASWGQVTDLSALAGTPLRLRFSLMNTRLYSFTVR